MNMGSIQGGTLILMGCILETISGYKNRPSRDSRPAPLGRQSHIFTTQLQWLVFPFAHNHFTNDVDFRMREI